MSADNKVRVSILREHTLTVAQHDHSLQTRTLQGFRRVVFSKLPFKASKYDRRANPTNSLNLRFFAKSWPKSWIPFSTLFE